MVDPRIHNRVSQMTVVGTTDVFGESLGSQSNGDDNGDSYGVYVRPKNFGRVDRTKTVTVVGRVTTSGSLTGWSKR